MESGVVARLPIPERNPFRASDNTRHGAKAKLMDTVAAVLAHGADEENRLAWRLEPGNMLSDVLKLDTGGKMVRASAPPVQGM